MIKVHLRSEKSGNTYFVPVKQTAIYQSPYYSLVILFDGFEFPDPFPAHFIVDLDFLVFIEVIIASMIGWDNTCLLDMTKEGDETIP